MISAAEMAIVYPKRRTPGKRYSLRLLPSIVLVVGAGGDRRCYRRSARSKHLSNHRLLYQFYSINKLRPFILRLKCPKIRASRGSVTAYSVTAYF